MLRSLEPPIPPRHREIVAIDRTHNGLRHLIVRYIRDNPLAKIMGAPIAQWVHWAEGDNGEIFGGSTAEYADKLAIYDTYGQGLEVAIFATIYPVYVAIVEKFHRSYRRTAEFGDPSLPTICIVYEPEEPGKPAHYNILSKPRIISDLPPTPANARQIPLPAFFTAASSSHSQYAGGATRSQRSNIIADCHRQRLCRQ